jgi:Tetratricopeptide repeat
MRVNRGGYLGNYRRSLRNSDLDGTRRIDGRLTGRTWRKLEIPFSGRTSILDGGRIVRRETDRYSSALTTRSLYDYHRTSYPSRRIFSWNTWPNCCRPICYTRGPRYTFGFFWPYYHRKFIFISIGGYWPGYTYRRYYWYGCHPYAWYGYWPPENVVLGGDYNYYYYSDKPAQSQALDQAQENLEENPPPEPAQETPADQYFEQAVKAFAAGDYATAAAKFSDARELAPDDIVLPFAYAQALFADGRYEKAAQLLRTALAKCSPEKEGVFYPRGLYRDEAVLQQQIEQLAEKIKQGDFDADLELLLGYQLLGTGRLDEAASHLQTARLNAYNSQGASVLLKLLKKLTR